jgi:hypothetical protein
VASQQVANAVLKPVVPATAGQVYFVELLVRRNGTPVDHDSAADLQGATPVVRVSGWNVPASDVPAG